MSTRDYLVIDLEATCDNQGTVPREQSEIIEIGAVLVDGRQFTPRAEWWTFVKPVRHPVLTAFCTELTTIQQEDVDTAPDFPAAVEAMAQFISSTTSSRQQTPLFASWGAYDRGQFKQDANFHGVTLPLSSDHLNVKQAFSDAMTTKRRFGMHRALRRLGLPLEGTHHRGIDDARNIAKILPYAVGARALPTPPVGWRRDGKRRGPMT